MRSDRRGSVKARISVEDLDVDALVTLKWINNEVRWEGVDWINLAQDNDKRQAVFEYGFEISGFIYCREFLNR